ncbi:hypothetical protein [Campylobacter sp. FOBRC14]|uniref:hypothetical protein n=1 Tax=Campylobacter sp. FOBRC14 TaxID=936554 RepID=UPI00027A3691|nr:hypothetical protein [Campylobacter sp. FOBRC14]EJP75707.1 hypothetical protein HMPREF1139_0651 [Campylobacter sp. FOBRC14]
MRKRVKRCEICSSKLDTKGECTWDGCPKSPKYETDSKELENTEKTEKGKK